VAEFNSQWKDCDPLYSALHTLNGEGTLSLYNDLTLTYRYVTWRISQSRGGEWWTSSISQESGKRLFAGYWLCICTGADFSKILMGRTQFFGRKCG